MKYRVLGNTGLNMSEIYFGAWSIASHWGTQSKSDAVEALHKSIDLGLNFICTALRYEIGKDRNNS